MKFNWKENTIEITFSTEERINLSKTGKLIIHYEDGRHFVNNLARIVAEIHGRFKKINPDFENKDTHEEDEIKTL